MRKYPTIDIAKLVLSVLVVILHVNPFGEAWGWIRFPITRIAVPLFFIISSFLFFEKIQDMENDFDKRNQLMRFCQRNLRLYITWFIVLLPITWHIRGYFNKSILELIKTIIVQFIFGSTFSVSWYIMALIIGTVLVYYLCKNMPGKIVAALGLILYMLCCLATNYRGLISTSGVLGTIIELYPTDIYLSFPASIIWIYLGKIISENKRRIQKINFGWRLAIGAVFLCVLYVEHHIIWGSEIAAENDCYFSLLLLCPWIFLVVLEIDFSARTNTKPIREISTIIYCSHRAFEWIYEAFFRKIRVDTGGIPGSVGLTVLVLASCLVLWAFICKVKNYRYFGWLKYLQ